MKNIAAKRCLIVCNGEIDKKLLPKFFRLNSKEKQIFVIAADGAANTLKKYGLSPDIITGDFDSIDNSTLTFYRKKKIRIQKILNQNRNDLEKALGFALVMQFSRIDVIGATGGRLDHTLNNLSILRKFSRLANIKFYDSEFEIFYLDAKEEFDYPKGEVVSLLALTEVRGVKTKGLKYPLKGESLGFGKRQGTLNSSSSEKINIEASKGDLLVFKKHFGKVV